MGEGGGADCGEQRHYPRPFTIAPAALRRLAGRLGLGMAARPEPKALRRSRRLASANHCWGNGVATCSRRRGAEFRRGGKTIQETYEGNSVRHLGSERRLLMS